jgi:hypothetical protein
VRVNDLEPPIQHEIPAGLVDVFTGRRHSNTPTAEDESDKPQKHPWPEEVQQPDPPKSECPVCDPFGIRDDRKRLRPFGQPGADVLRLRLHDYQDADAGRGEPAGVAGHLPEVGDTRDSDEMTEEDYE